MKIIGKTEYIDRKFRLMSNRVEFFLPYILYMGCEACKGASHACKSPQK